MFWRQTLRLARDWRGAKSPILRRKVTKLEHQVRSEHDVTRSASGGGAAETGAGQAQAAESNRRMVEYVLRGGLKREPVLLVNRYNLANRHIRSPVPGSADVRGYAEHAGSGVVGEVVA